MLTQADIDAAVSESLAKTQELLSEYGEQFVRPLMEVQKAMDARQMHAGMTMNEGGEDGQREMDQDVSAGHAESTEV